MHCRRSLYLPLSLTRVMFTSATGGSTTPGGYKYVAGRFEVYYDEFEFQVEFKLAEWPHNFFLQEPKSFRLLC